MRKFIAGGLLAMSFGSLAPARAAEMIEAGHTNQVFVLKHPSRGAAFVRTSDSDRLVNLVENEGYEVVARNTARGPEPVVADVVPEELVNEELASNAALSTVMSSNRPRRAGDIFDIGLGLNIGLTPGGKVRLLATLDNGLVVGVDLDVGTIIFISDATISGILGYSFEVGRHIIRPYLTVGGGSSAIFALFAFAEGRIFHGGIGFEWKPARWFGLGLEGGVNVFDCTNCDATVAYPYARLTVMFYFF